MRRFFLYATTLMMLGAHAACAQTKKAGSGGSSEPVFIQATQQRTLPGRQESSISVSYRFQMIWKGSSAPTNLYWRPDANSWMEVKVARPIKRPLFAGSNDFMIIEQNVELRNIRNGDTLVLTARAHSHDHDPMPSIVKKQPGSSMYYQTAAGGGKWQYKSVKMRKLPDLALP